VVPDHGACIVGEDAACLRVAVPVTRFIYQLRGIRARKAPSAEGRPHLRGFPRNTDSVDCDEGAFHRMGALVPVSPSRAARATG